jgi:N,N'-diacetyllegionaminate synthase
VKISGEFSKVFSIAHRKVGHEQPVFVVAEAGVAHFGSVEKAMALVDMAVAAKADAVKFQVFRTDELISKESQEWRDRLRPKELPFDAFRRIQRYCDEKKIIFFATAHEESSLEDLDKLNVPVYKIGSGELENWPFLEKIASRKKPVIFSTGMHTMEQIEQALGILERAKNPDVAVLHCVTQYPSRPADVNLRAMEAIQSKFGVIVGYSDHTEGFHFPLAAVALGAKVIEKHISVDFNIPNAQDWKVSCGAADLQAMVRQIREIENGLGSGEKAPSETERMNLSWARKSLVAARDIEKGEEIRSDMLRTKRPGTGISPARMGEVIGKRAKNPIPQDNVIRWEELA